MGDRESRAPVVWTCLIAGGLGILASALAAGGRLGWTAPVICLPLALGLARVWGEWKGLPDSRWQAILYYLWALVLLWESARGYSRRLMVTLPGDSPWLFLFAAAALCLWLCRGEGFVTLRAGRVFFGAVAVVLGAAVALSLPGLRWENLWSVEGEAVRGLPRAVLLCLSLAGYGIYGSHLPGAALPERRDRVWPWPVAICAAMAGLLLALTGSFGPALAAGRPEPVLLLLEGVQVPGVFRHGEAALECGLALADLTLMATLTYGCKALWGRLSPRTLPWLGLVPAGVAILAAGVVPEGWRTALTAQIVPAGNLLFGAALPCLALLTEKAVRRK